MFSILPHKTSPNKSDELRLTLGMDIILTEEEYHQKNSQSLRSYNER